MRTSLPSSLETLELEEFREQRKPMFIAPLCGARCCARPCTNALVQKQAPDAGLGMNSSPVTLFMNIAGHSPH